MTSYAAPARRSAFTVGEALQATFASIGANFVVLFTLALVLVGVPRLFMSLLSLAMIADVSGRGPLFLSFNWVVLGSIVSLITTMVLQASAVRVTVTYLNGRRPAIGESLAHVARLILPLLAIAILSGLAIAFGLILLVIPGVFLMVAWSMVVPAEVIERTGVFAAFGRSLRLTEGFRWSILWTYLVVVVIGLVISLIGNLATTFLNMLVIAGGGLLGGALTLPGLAIAAVTSSIVAIVQASATAAIYSELRRVKEGATPQALAAIFD
jgi:hypothetical protein